MLNLICSFRRRCPSPPPAPSILRHPSYDAPGSLQELAESLREQLQESAMSEREAIESDTVLRSRINRVAGFTIVILLSVSGWQLALLNKFFRWAPKKDGEIDTGMLGPSVADLEVELMQRRAPDSSELEDA